MSRLNIVLLVLIVAIVALSATLYQPDLDRSYLRSTYTNERSAFTPVAGMDVHYRIEGQGPVVVLLHGTGASLHTWDGWMDALTSVYTVVRLDLPAFGLTGPHPQRRYGIGDYVSFLDHFLDQLNLEQVYLAGNSLGGGIAWTFAATHPDKVNALILIDSSGHPRQRRPLVFTLAQNPITASLLVNTAPVAFMHKTLKEVYHNDSLIDDALVKRYRDLSLFPGNRQAFVDRATTPLRYDLAALSTLSMPILIMWGEKDTWIPVSDAHAFHQQLPNSQLIVYPELGHVPMEEDPNTTVDDAMTFLKAIGDAKVE